MNKKKTMKALVLIDSAIEKLLQAVRLLGEDNKLHNLINWVDNYYWHLHDKFNK